MTFVATEKPLSLRRQRSSTRKKRSPSEKADDLQAEVLVDTGVFHLDHPYSYLVGADLQDWLNIGSIVTVPFNNKTAIGVVIDIKSPDKSGLKHIETLVHEKGLSETSLALVEKMVDRYATSRFDVFRFMLPPLSKSAPRQAVKTETAANKLRSNIVERHFIVSEIGEGSLETVRASLIRAPGLRRIVVVPTLRDVVHLREALEKSNIPGIIEWGSHLTPSQRRSAFAMALDGSATIIIGTRGAIFAPISNLDEIVIVDEFSQHHYELKSPYWNTRDVALLRSEVEGTSIAFVANSSSLELFRLIEKGWIRQKKRSAFSARPKRSKVITAPESYHSTVREGLKTAPVLFSVIEKRYSNAFNCDRCRTIARCECGGRVVIEAKGVFTCSICDKQEYSWMCRECGTSRIRTFQFGAERIKEDISKTFPGIPIFLNTAEKIVEGPLPTRSIVVSTHGVEPQVQGGYGAIVLLGGEELVNRPLIRSEEEALSRWFKVLSHLRKGGGIYASLPAQHGITQAIIQQNPMKFLAGESLQRLKLNLPPHSRLIIIRGDALSIPNLQRKLDSQFEGKLVTHTSLDGKVLTLKVKHDAAHEVLSALRALQKLRSVKKKDLLSIRVDPYEI